MHTSQASRRHGFTSPATQHGAVLYVALIMLILLALLGIAGMQVAGMQEKMASNFRSVNRSFQNTEGVVRSAESTIEAIANRTGLPSDSLLDVADISQACDDGYDPVAWGQDQTTAAAPAVNVRQIDTCIVGEASLDMGRPLDPTSPVYQITGFSADDPDAATSSVVIDTVFKL